MHKLYLSKGCWSWFCFRVVVLSILELKISCLLEVWIYSKRNGVMRDGELFLMVAFTVNTFFGKLNFCVGLQLLCMYVGYFHWFENLRRERKDLILPRTEGEEKEVYIHELCVSELPSARKELFFLLPFSPFSPLSGAVPPWGPQEISLSNKSFLWVLFRDRRFSLILTFSNPRILESRNFGIGHMCL